MKLLKKSLVRIRKSVVLFNYISEGSGGLFYGILELIKGLCLGALEGVHGVYSRFVPQLVLDTLNRENKLIKYSDLPSGKILSKMESDQVLSASSTGVRGYIINAPDFVANSAGVRSLFTLCHNLNELGYPSFITGRGITRTSPNEKAPIISFKTALKLAKMGFTVIYPEIISGNPLRAKRVCRWVLNRPGLLGGDKIYDKNELVFNYSDVFLPYIQNKIAGKLYLPTIDQSIFYCDPEKDIHRGIDCYYIGKSQFRSGFFDPNLTFEITREAPKKVDLGNLFRGSRTLYCFDNSTILIYEAILCGCRVVIIPDGTHTKADYEKLELGMDGIAWGVEEKDKVQASPDLLKKHLAQLNAEFQGQLKHLIKLTQN